MKLDLFDFPLPEELIAHQPTEQRDASRLLVVDRKKRSYADTIFSSLVDSFHTGDVLVLNASRVIPARIALEHGAEIFLSKKLEPGLWECLVKKGKRFPEGKEIFFPDGSKVFVEKRRADGLAEIRFFPVGSFETFLEQYGELPLPPYLKRKPNAADLQRYQTVYAQEGSSVAAPTAGLHFTEEILHKLENKGVQIEYVFLHVGLGTFLPVKAENLEEHDMHSESFFFPEEVAKRIEQAKTEGRKIIAGGTTSLRTLESAWQGDHFKTGHQETKLFVYPPYDFSVVSGLLTNFHLPKSTLLMLLSAFATPGSTEGIAFVQEVYAHAITEQYRFFSYGDATLWI